MSEAVPQLIQVSVNNLDPGMFIAELDIPWLESPFAMQGFHVMSEEDIAQVASCCSFVYVDPHRTSRPVPMQLLVDQPTRYENTVTMGEELEQARADFESASEAVSDTFARIREGGAIDLVEFEKAVVPVIDSVLRNQDAMAALIRLRDKDDYGYGHCIATAVWATVLARHIGLQKEEIRDLALGASLIDVGKVKIDQALLEKPGPLSDDEWAIMRSHVEHSLAMLDEVASSKPDIIDVVAAHHERHDGSGYPHGLSGYDIPIGARIAGIADSYDAMITERPYARARSSFEAMQELSDLAGSKFQEALIEQFMQAVGLFPNGSLVELNTGEVGIVQQQNPTRRLKPVLVMVLDAQKRKRERLETRDLFGYRSAEGSSTWITRELKPGSHGIAPEDYYL